MSSINDIFSKVQNMLGMGLGIPCYIVTEVRVNLLETGLVLFRLEYGSDKSSGLRFLKLD